MIIFKKIQKTERISIKNLLLFGTPTLLLMDIPYPETLSILVPCSLSISTIQFLKNYEKSRAFTKRFCTYCIPLVVTTIYLTNYFEKTINLYKVIGIILLIISISRVSEKITMVAKHYISRYQTQFLAITGVIHGLSNMGGSFLSIYATTQYTNKVNILACISSGYFLFGVAQILTLIIMNLLVINMMTSVYISLSIMIYMTFGRKIFPTISNEVYQSIFTGFLVIYGILLITK